MAEPHPHARCKMISAGFFARLRSEIANAYGIDRLLFVISLKAQTIIREESIWEIARVSIWSGLSLSQVRQTLLTR